MFFNRVKYVLQKLLDNLELWLKTLLLSKEGGFQSKNNLDRSARQILAARGMQGCTL